MNAAVPEGRRNGQTTRAILEAIRRCLQGEQVVYLTQNTRETERNFQIAGDVLWALRIDGTTLDKPNRRISFGETGQIVFVDWETWQRDFFNQTNRRSNFHTINDVKIW